MRLEFQAAIMATCFKVFSLEEIKENILKVLLWIDSKTILSYLRNEDKFWHFCSTRYTRKYAITQHLMIGITYQLRTILKLSLQDYRPDFLQAFEFNTFDDSLVLQNNLMNSEDIHIITKSQGNGSNYEAEMNWACYLSLPKLVCHISWILKLKHY